MLDKIKAHVERNRERYITGSVVVVAGITCYIVRGRTDFLRSSEAIAGNTALVIRPLAFFSKQTVVVIVREGRGHPGYLTRCIETGQTFLTQGDAARQFGTSAQNMSSHLKGNFSDIYGFHFERLAA